MPTPKVTFKIEFFHKYYRMEKNEFLKLLPKLIREDDEVKGAIITALSGVVATKDDIQQLIKVMDKRFESVDKRFESVDKRFDRLIQVMENEFKDAKDDRLLIKTSLGSLGNRSGTIFIRARKGP
ncbi:MAG: hypothetical protein ACTSWY_03915 [Promethearchaeota archaeon]